MLQSCYKMQLLSQPPVIPLVGLQSTASGFLPLKHETGIRMVSCRKCSSCSPCLWQPVPFGYILLCARLPRVARPRETCGSLAPFFCPSSRRAVLRVVDVCPLLSYSAQLALCHCVEVLPIQLHSAQHCPFFDNHTTLHAKQHCAAIFANTSHCQRRATDN
jgi:hypothetical protein